MYMPLLISLIFVNNIIAILNSSTVVVQEQNFASVTHCVYVCICICECSYTCVTVYLWKSEHTASSIGP